VAEIQEVAGQDQLFQGNLVDRLAFLDHMPGHIEMRAAMFRQQNHLGLVRDPIAADHLDPVETVHAREGDRPTTAVGHALVEFVAEIDDFADGFGNGACMVFLLAGWNPLVFSRRRGPTSLTDGGVAESRTRVSQ